MWEEIAKYLTVLFVSMFKFIGGPLAGKGFDLPILVTILLTAAGTMATVAILNYGGKGVVQWVKRKLIRKKRTFSPRSRRFVRIWNNYGVQGVAFLTPLILTPLGGALITAAYAANRSKVMLYMLISSLTWATILTIGVYFFADLFI